MSLTEEQIALAYDHFGHLVFRRCRSILRDRHQAEDALHEVYVRLMKYGDGFEKAEAPVRWLYRVAEHVCFDLLRRGHQVSESEQMPKQTPTAAQGFAHEVSDREVLCTFLGHFDDRTKRLILLYHLDGLSQEQIAQEIGWSRQTVNRKLGQVQHKAEKLRKQLGVV